MALSAESGNLVRAAERETLDVSTVLRAFGRHRWKAALITGTFALLATGVAFYLPNVYEVSVVLAPAPNAASPTGSIASLGGIAALAGIPAMGGADPKQEAIAVLRSRALAEEFVTANSLMPVLFASDWDAEKGRWLSDDPQDVPTLDDAFTLWDEKVRTVAEDTFTGLVTLTIAWRNPDDAARWAAQFVQLANAKLRERAIEDSRRSVDYLQKELAKTMTVEVRQSINSLIESQVNKAMLAEVQTDYAFRVIDPPAVPDADNYDRPKRALLILLGLAFGAFISAFVVVNLPARH